MSEGSQNDEDYEEEEDDNNSSQIDEMLNEAERWKSVGNKHMAAMVRNKNRFLFCIYLIYILLNFTFILGVQ